ncbi:MAG: glycosyltransferase [Bacilli bacterium]|nr:glycosyltransferase [Bacilli bacterium]
MEKEILLSIIIPAFNSEKYLPKAIESLANQTRNDCFEVLLMIDPGTDKTFDVAKSLSTTNKFLKIYYFDTRQGVAKCRFIGLNKAVGKYFIFMDADDEIAPNMVETIVKEMEESKADGLCFNFYYITDKKGKRKDNLFPFSKNKTYDRADAVKAFFEDTYIRGFLWNKCYKREIADSRPFVLLADKKDMFEDIVVTLTFLSNCDKVKSIKTPLYYYDKRIGDSASSLHRTDRAMRHLKVFAVERYYLEYRGDKALLKAYKRTLWRDYASLLFDLHLDKKYGADKAYVKSVKKEWKYVKNMKKPLLIEGRAYEEEIKRCLYFDKDI